MVQRLPFDVMRLRGWSPADQSAWQAAIAAGDVFDGGGGALATYDTDRRRIFEAAFGRWLGYLATVLHDEVGSGLDHCSRELVSRFVEVLLEAVAPCTARGYVTDLLTAARAMAPGNAFAALHGATRYLWRTARPAKDKRSRLVPSGDLVALGFELMETAARCSTPLKAASRYRDGLMIAFLAYVPVRLGNFASIQIDRHLTRHGDGWWLNFPGVEVKNRRPLEFPAPDALIGVLDHYLTTVRPLLLARSGRWKREAGNALWISESGAPMGDKQISARICRATKAKFGFPINPHLFRDCAATSIALADPEHVGIITAILGHSTIQTAERFYNQAGTVQAARRYQGVVLGFRSAAG